MATVRDQIRNRRTDLKLSLTPIRLNYFFFFLFRVRFNLENTFYLAKLLLRTICGRRNVSKPISDYPFLFLYLFIISYFIRITRIVWFFFFFLQVRSYISLGATGKLKYLAWIKNNGKNHYRGPKVYLFVSSSKMPHVFINLRTSFAFYL